jgi:hypothetical protein
MRGVKESRRIAHAVYVALHNRLKLLALALQGSAIERFTAPSPRLVPQRGTPG